MQSHAVLHPGRVCFDPTRTQRPLTVPTSSPRQANTNPRLIEAALFVVIGSAQELELARTGNQMK